MDQTHEEWEEEDGEEELIESRVFVTMAKCDDTRMGLAGKKDYLGITVGYLCPAKNATFFLQGSLGSKVSKDIQI